MVNESRRSIRPRRRTDLDAFPVADELVLVPRRDDRVFALNASGAAIWELCDGAHGLEEMLVELRERYQGDDVEILGDVSAALLELQSLGLVETAAAALGRPSDPGAVALGAASGRRKVHFVHGIEDRIYFHWQLAVFYESLVGQLPAGWTASVVVCNGNNEVSDELRHIVDTYEVNLLTGESLGDLHSIDFADGGERYVPLNRVEALAVLAEHVPPEDVVCLMDTDLYLVGDLQEHLFPTGNAMAKNWIISQEKYFQFSVENEARGVSIPKLLEALGCDQEFKPGGVTVFLSGQTLHNRKVIKDCFRFLQVLYLLGKIGNFPEHGVWVSEMACFALALVPNGVEMELLETPQFSVQEPGVDSVPEGSFFHYYMDVNDNGDGPFPESQWHKQLYRDRNLLLEDLDSFLDNSRSQVERRFFEVAAAAKARLYGNNGHS